ncbi:MAG TPA: hypothetical protein VNI34_03660 [Candidatus Nitrosotalea sp.]|nr:hypothetical protein [Candidatus Nitrosotalea sp.]
MVGAVAAYLIPLAVLLLLTPPAVPGPVVLPSASSATASPSPTPSPTPPPSPTPSAGASPSPAPAPSASPTPVIDAGTLNLAPAAGTPGEVIAAQGSGFPAGLQGNLSLGSTPLGSAQADPAGSWQINFTIPGSAPIGVDLVCFDQRCGSLTVSAIPTPSATPAASPSPAPSPTASPSARPLSPPAGSSGGSPLAALLHPAIIPWGLLPFLFLALLTMGLRWWRRRPPLIDAVVTHQHGVTGSPAPPAPSAGPASPASGFRPGPRATPSGEDPSGDLDAD